MSTVATTTQHCQTAGPHAPEEAGRRRIPGPRMCPAGLNFDTGVGLGDIHGHLNRLEPHRSRGRLSVQNTVPQRFRRLTCRRFQIWPTNCLYLGQRPPRRPRSQALSLNRSRRDDASYRPWTVGCQSTAPSATNRLLTHPHPAAADSKARPGPSLYGRRLNTMRHQTDSRGPAGSGCSRMRCVSTTRPPTRCSWMIRSSTGGSHSRYQAPSG